MRECVVCLTVSFRQSYISSEENKKGRELVSELMKMSVGYEKFVKRNANK
jgi:hypothetical protein